MKITKSYDGSVCVVFRDEYTANRWSWLFYTILRRRMVCFGGFFNAWKLW